MQQFVCLKETAYLGVTLFVSGNPDARKITILEGRVLIRTNPETKLDAKLFSCLKYIAGLFIILFVRHVHPLNIIRTFSFVLEIIIDKRRRSFSLCIRPRTITTAAVMMMMMTDVGTDI